MTEQTQSKRSSKKIPAHYGMQDYYEHYAKCSDNPVNRIEYNNIISDFNLSILDEILNNYKVYTIPLLRLKIGVRKAKPKIRMEDGVVVNGNPIDWATTNKLWEEDEESRKNRTLVRHTNRHSQGYVFRIYALKFAARFKNKSIFRFKPVRRFQRALTERIKDESKEKFDSYLLYEEN